MVILGSLGTLGGVSHGVSVGESLMGHVVSLEGPCEPLGRSLWGPVNVTKEVIQVPDRPNGGVTRCPHEVSRGSLGVGVGVWGGADLQ